MFLILTALPLAFEYYLVAIVDFKTLIPGFPLRPISVTSEVLRLLAQYLLWRLFQQLGLQQSGLCHLLDFFASAPTSLLSHFMQWNTLGTIKVGHAELTWLQIIRTSDAALNSYCLYDLFPKFVAARQQHYMMKVFIFAVLAIVCYFFAVVIEVLCAFICFGTGLFAVRQPLPREAEPIQRSVPAARRSSSKFEPGLASDYKAPALRVSFG